MKRLTLLFILILLLPALLTACSQKTALRFTNNTECGAASITLTNIKSGNITEHTVEQGKSVEIEIDPAVEYRYDVEYPRMSNSLQCDSKRVTTALEKGQTLNIKLVNELDESLEQATATAEAAGAASTE